MIIPFPKHLTDTMILWIKSFIATSTGGAHADLEEQLQVLSDALFVEKFHKAFRIFPSHVADEIAVWVESLAHFLGGKQAGMNYVSLAERMKNSGLTEKSWDTFWRCVRPNKPDVGSAHCDYQFWEIAKGTVDEPSTPFSYDERWKIWIPLLGCNPLTSLQVIPGSHVEEIPIDNIATKYGIKPTIDPEWLLKNEGRFICPLEQFSGCAVLFHDKLVHRGPPNPSQQLRISGELTIILALYK